MCFEVNILAGKEVGTPRIPGVSWRKFYVVSVGCPLNFFTLYNSRTKRPRNYLWPSPAFMVFSRGNRLYSFKEWEVENRVESNIQLRL